ncbi:Serine/threonine-protein phosphatase 1 regulatory subunit 10 [Sarcoptes scabiei]|uniref:Serine/threonine-protein phosphatase 1 regulatory subunit 10 n=1 Tax=Sarcoptes scabiei TaxID=52283 RepID=A0A834VET7_SARSC|nr:Serine/threonine-protein phosphatase 1 regulatory subunit 10 [Sarcoptes scabiei]
MAPINPEQILDAFTPLLTDNGGIKPVDHGQFVKIYDIMKSYSTKLVSKCIYHQILMSTKPDVLEQFLQIGGWDLIYIWVKSSRDLGNVTFLIDLLKLLQILPMSLERLRQNECPKIVKKLCKHENQDISMKANQIIKKWTKIIQSLSTVASNPGKNSKSGDFSNSLNGKEKKRKLSDSSVKINSNQTIESKKSRSSPLTGVIDHDKNDKIINDLSNKNNDLMMRDEHQTKDPSSNQKQNDNQLNVSNDSNVNDGVSSKTITSVSVDGNSINGSSDPSRDSIVVEGVIANSSSATTAVALKATKRPVTVKVKQGKFRLDLSEPSVSVSSSSTASSVQSLSNKPESKIKKISKVISKNPNDSMSPQPSKQILKDSMSFIDAISVGPIVGMKRRRKLQNKDLSLENANYLNNNNNKIMNISQHPEEKSLDSNDKLNDLHFNKSLNSGSLSITSSASGPASSSTTPSTSLSTILLVNSSETNKDSSDILINDFDENRKKSEESNEKQSSHLSKSSLPPPPKFSFYKDILDEKCNNDETDSLAKSSPDKSSNLAMNIDKDDERERVKLEFLAENNIDIIEDNKLDQKDDSDHLNLELKGDDASLKKDELQSINEQDVDLRQSECLNQNDVDHRFDQSQSMRKPKPILSLVKKNHKKRVRWPEDDSKLELVKYFELDENERINVTRPSADMKRFDMKHEAQMLSEARKGRCFSYGPWKLIPIDLDPINCPVERGRDSKEKLIQTERMRTTLECFYFNNQIPDNPDDPDTNSSFDLGLDSSEKLRIIPLEDDMGLDKVQDYGQPIQQMPIQQSPPVSMMINHNSSNLLNNPVDCNNINSFNDSQNYLGFNANQLNHNNNANSFPNGPYQSGPAGPNQQQSFDNPSVNYQYNSNVNNYPPQSQPLPAYAPGMNGPFNNDFNVQNGPNCPQPPPPSNFMGPGFNQNQGPNTPHNQMMPPVSNYFNNNQAVPPPGINNHQQPPPGMPLANENYPNYWPDNQNNNFNSMPPVPQQPFSGPRFRPRGPNNGPRPRFMPRNNSDVCRFFLRTGKCKFENRCNFSHAIENQKPPIRF